MGRTGGYDICHQVRLCNEHSTYEVIYFGKEQKMLWHDSKRDVEENLNTSAPFYKGRLKI